MNAYLHTALAGSACKPAPPLPIMHALLTAQILQGNTFFIYSQTFLKKNVHSEVSHEDTEFSVKFSRLLGKDLN